MGEPTGDSDLLARVRAEPQAAIADVLTCYERPLLRYARALVGSDGAAQDVVQEAFLRLLRKARSVRNLPSWLGRVTHNLAIDHLRREARMKKAHQAAVVETGPEPTVPPDAARADAAALERELGLLTPNERAVIVLKVIEGKSYKEISAVTGLSTSNIGYLIHHGLKKLAAKMGAAGAPRGGVR
jgi:RNA polymerase sigma factor (sigma-70 family)